MGQTGYPQGRTRIAPGVRERQGMHHEIRPIQCFVMLAEKLNFSLAAAELNMTQPTLSSQIKRLEDSIGHDLFVRTTRKVELSDFGRSILPAALRLVEAQADFQTTLKTLDASDRSICRIASPFYTTGIPERENLFRQFEVECANVGISLTYGFKQQLLTQLETHAIDLALLIGFPVDRAQFIKEQARVDTSEIIVPDDLPRITLASKPVLLAVPHEDSLASYDVVPLSALAGRKIGMLHANHGNCFVSPLLRLLEAAGAHTECPLDAHGIGLERYVRERRVPSFSVGWYQPPPPDADVSYHAVEGVNLSTELMLVRGLEKPGAATMQLWRSAERFAARNR